MIIDSDTAVGDKLSSTYLGRVVSSRKIIYDSYVNGENFNR